MLLVTQTGLEQKGGRAVMDECWLGASGFTRI